MLSTPLRRSRPVVRALVWAGLATLATPVKGRAQEQLTLHQAIERAIESPRAQIADEQVNLARAARTEASLALNPRLYLQSEDLHPWDRSFSFVDNTEDYAYLSQTFEIDGKRSKRVRLAEADIEVRETEHQLELRRIAADVAAAYWSAVAAGHIADTLREDLAAVDAMVKYHQERVDAGAMRGVDLVRIEIERDRVSLSLQAAERDAQLARTELFRQIGSVRNPNAVLADDIAVTAVLPEVDLQAALARRAEISSAEEQIAAAEADLRLQRADAVPDLDLLGGYKRNVGVDTVYGALQLPLPFRNRNQGGIARAQVRLRLAHEQLAQVRTTVELDIQAATETYHRELAVVRDTLPQMRARARKNLDVETEAYQLGGVDLLRYIDAERTAYDVEVTAIRTLSEFHQAEARLLLAYGGQP